MELRAMLGAADPKTVCFNGSSMELGRLADTAHQDKPIAEQYKWLLASQDLWLEDWVAQKGEPLQTAIAAAAEQRGEQGSEWYQSREYVRLCLSDSLFEEYSKQQHYIEYLTAVAAALDRSTEEAQQKAAYSELVRENQYQYRVRKVLREMVSSEGKTAQLQSAAAADLKNYDDTLAAVKDREGSSYQSSVDYMKNELKYEDVLKGLAPLEDAAEEAGKAVKELRTGSRAPARALRRRKATIRRSSCRSGT